MPRAGRYAARLAASRTGDLVPVLEARLGHAAAARRTLDGLPRSTFLPSVTRHRVRAAVLLAEGDGAGAQAAVRDARSGLDDALAAPGIEVPWLEELDTEARLMG